MMGNIKQLHIVQKTLVITGRRGALLLFGVRVDAVHFDDRWALGQIGGHDNLIYMSAEMCIYHQKYALERSSTP
jgi:hypothetical protein